VELALPAGAKYTLHAQTRHGEITNDLDQRLQGREDGESHTLEGVMGGPIEVKVATERGEVTLRKSTGIVAAMPPEMPKMPKLPAPPAPPEHVQN